MPWGLLYLASSAFANRITIRNPLDGTPISAALGVALVTPSANWQVPFTSWLKDVSRSAGIRVETGTPTGYEEAGAIDALRRAADMAMLEQVGSREDEVKSLTPSDLSEMADFNTDDVIAVDGAKQNPRFPWVVNSLDRLLTSTRPGLYHVLRDGLEQQAIRRLQHRSVVHVPPIALSLFSTSSIEEMMRVFEKRESIALMSRMSVVYHYVQEEYKPSEPIRVRQAEQNEIDKFVIERLKGECNQSIAFDPDAVKLLRRFYGHAGAGQISKNLQDYQSERGRHLIRISVLVALLRDAIESTVRVSDIQTAELLLASSEESINAIYLAVGMGAIGRVLALMIEAAEAFRSSNQPFNYRAAVAWAATSGIPFEQTRKYLDALVESSLLKQEEDGNLSLPLHDTKLRMSVVLRRIGLTKSLAGMKQ